MPNAWPSKDPDEALRYTYDATPDLADTEVITAASATPLVAAGTTNDPATHDDKHVSVMIRGGTDGLEASFQLDFSTSAGETFQAVIALPISSKVVPVPYPGGYAEPTVPNFLAAFPEFDGVRSSTIRTYLDRAARSVDSTWMEGDFGYARMLLAAHLLTIGGLGSSAAAASFAAGSEQFDVITSGSLRVERSGSGGGSAAGLGQTRYGREFRTLLRANRGGARTTGALPGGGGWGDNFGPWTVAP